MRSAKARCLQGLCHLRRQARPGIQVLDHPDVAFDINIVSNTGTDGSQVCDGQGLWRSSCASHQAVREAESGTADCFAALDPPAQRLRTDSKGVAHSPGLSSRISGTGGPANMVAMKIVAIAAVGGTAWLFMRPRFSPIIPPPGPWPKSPQSEPEAETQAVRPYS